MITLNSDVQSKETLTPDEHGQTPIEDYTSEGLEEAIIQLIPDGAWDKVLEGLVELLVDYMPCNILDRLTGDPEGYEKASNMLLNYYSQSRDMHHELIHDCLLIIPDHVVLSTLDQLQLDGIHPATNDEFC